MSRERSTNHEGWESVECRTMDPDMWFMDTTDTKGVPMQQHHFDALKLALEACNRCPLRVECLILGMAEEDRPHGIWGGLLPGERHALAKETKFGVHRHAIERARLIRNKTGVPMP